MNKKIFIACDTTDQKKVQRIIKESNTNKLKIGYKFGLEFFYSKHGRYFLSKIDRKKTIFLDLKLNDIPNTCVSTLRSFCALIGTERYLVFVADFGVATVAIAVCCALGIGGAIGGSCSTIALLAVRRA